MKANQFYVYTHARPNTTDLHGIFYVGKGNLKRTKEISRKNNYHSKIISKYGKENIIVRKLPCESEQHAFDLEIQIIAKLREIGIKLTNLNDGGEGLKNPSVETRLKISLGNKGKTVSEETRIKNSMASKLRSKEISKVSIITHTGRKNSQETIERMKTSQRAYRKNNPVSEETRAKMAASAKVRKSPPISEETRLKMAESAKKRERFLFSDEHKNKLSKATSSRGEEWKKKLSEAAKKKME